MWIKRVKGARAVKQDKTRRIKPTGLFLSTWIRYRVMNEGLPVVSTTSSRAFSNQNVSGGNNIVPVGNERHNQMTSHPSLMVNTKNLAAIKQVLFEVTNTQVIKHHLIKYINVFISAPNTRKLSHQEYLAHSTFYVFVLHNALKIWSHVVTCEEILLLYVLIPRLYQFPQ